MPGINLPPASVSSSEHPQFKPAVSLAQETKRLFYSMQNRFIASITKEGLERIHINCGAECTALDTTPDGSFLAWGRLDGQVHIISLDHHIESSLKVHINAVEGVLYQPNRTTISYAKTSAESIPYEIPALSDQTRNNTYEVLLTNFQSRECYNFGEFQATSLTLQLQKVIFGNKNGEVGYQTYGRNATCLIPTGFKQVEHIAMTELDHTCIVSSHFDTRLTSQIVFTKFGATLSFSNCSTDRVTGIKLAPDDKLIAMTHFTGSLSLWSIQTQNIFRQIDPSPMIPNIKYTSITICESGKKIHYSDGKALYHITIL